MALQKTKSPGTKDNADTYKTKENKTDPVHDIDVNSSIHEKFSNL